jgi:predicted protein tyrosine phosphatase
MAKPFPNIVITSASKAKGLSYKRDFSHAIQILDPEEGNFPFICGRALRLRFYDVIKEGWNDWTGPTREDITKIIDYAKVMDLDNSIFHCYAGHSRSPAAAIIAMAAIHGDITEWREEFYNRFPSVNPNPLMLDIGSIFLPSIITFKRELPLIGE